MASESGIAERHGRVRLRRFLIPIGLAGPLAMGIGCSGGGGGGAESLGVTPSSGFACAGIPGGPFQPSERTYTINNTDAEALLWSATASQPWLSLSQASGSVPAGGQEDVVVSIDLVTTSAMPLGGYQGEITFSGSGGNDVVRLANLTLSSPGSSVGLGCPREPAIQCALNAAFIWFDHDLAGGAHTWIFNGGEVGKAITSLCGDTRTDDLLLQQIRHLLVQGNGPTATGGYQDQRQMGASLMFLVSKHTPRIWGQLTVQEREKIETIMKACLLSAAFTSSDLNYHQVNSETLVDMLGVTNYVHGNPNFRNGIIGQVIVSTLFLGREAAEQFLATYDHGLFRSELQAQNLANLYRTYTSSDSNAPTATEIEWTVNQGYVYHTIPHDELLDIYVDLTMFTYDRLVSCAANPGNVGILGNNGIWGGYMNSNCAGLPRQGTIGMLTEFDRWDGGGRRVSAIYANDGWYVNNYIHLALLLLDEWEDTPATQEVLDRLLVGTEDLLFKIDPVLSGGYYSFHHGDGTSTPYLWNDDEGHTINASISRDLIYAYHGL